MQMTLRWYGSKFDTVTLEQIRQIPGGITTLYDTQPGEVWSRERIRAMKEEVEVAGLQVAGIESVNVHEDIKAGTSSREQYIANYIETLENLGKEDIHLVCYNFMPVFDWIRTELARVRADGSTVLAYTQEVVNALNPEKMFDSIADDMNGTVMPGWEPERMTRVKELFALYKDTYKIMKALYDIGFDGPIRPDHGRMIWGETAMPGYGLYDRALGAAYLNGIWEAIEKSSGKV